MPITITDDNNRAPILSALRESVRTFRAGEPETTDPKDRGAGPIVLRLVSHALDASLVGPDLERAADMSDGSLRRLAAGQLCGFRATAGLPDPSPRGGERR